MWMLPWAKPSPESQKQQGFLAQDHGSRSVLAKQNESVVSRYRISSLIAPGMRIRGDVQVAESLMVLGSVDGDVRVEGKGMALLAKKGSAILGNVEAGIVLLAGEVFGDVEGSIVRLYGTATVHGRISARRLIVDDGAVVMNEQMQVGQTPIDDQPVHGVEEGLVQDRLSNWPNISHLPPRDRLNYIRARACVGR